MYLGNNLEFYTYEEAGEDEKHWKTVNDIITRITAVLQDFP